MFSYYLRLSWLSLKRNPLLSSLMVGAIALGIGVSMTTLTLFYVMSSDPLPFKSDRVFAVQMDTWGPDEPANRKGGGSPPIQMTYRDAMALMESDIPTHQATMLHRGFAVRTEDEDVRLQRLSARATYNGFFPMFDVPFLYGGPWDDRADENADQVVILSRESNEKFFGGQNSVGNTIFLDSVPFRVVGVINSWQPTPVFYDLNNGAWSSTEDMFIPFQIPITWEYGAHGSTNCWKPEKLENYQDSLQSECVWVQHWVQLDSAEQREAFHAFMDGYANAQKEFGRFQRPLDNRTTNVMDWLEYMEVVGDDNRLLVVLSLMFLLICLLNTVGLMLAKFLNRAPLVGVRRALGASKRDVALQHGVEVMFIGLLGGLGGLVLSYLGLLAVRNWYTGYEYLARLNPEMIATAVALALGAAVIAGLYPTWHITRIQPAVHLKTQ
ncbi:MAG: ABC transporter permease [Pseudomonadota bacterium]